MAFKNPREMHAKLRELGYKIEAGTGHNYVNRYNGAPYKARCVGCIVEIDTGISFAHYKDARTDANFDALQALRGDPFWYRGRLWEF